MTLAAYAIINTKAVKHNLKKVKEFAPNSKIMSVIKSDAYGHGLIPIAKALENSDAFAVARLAEGICLRRAGIVKKIIVLEGFVYQSELDELLKYNLDFVVHSVEQVDILEQYKTDKKLFVWLKLDTGMSRLGFKAAEFDLMYQRLSACIGIEQPLRLMTHFSNADDLTSEMTQQQIKLFSELTNIYKGEKSIANSAGIMAWPNSLTDWVRPGIMLYGISPFEDKKGQDLGLKPVMSLHSHLIAVKTIGNGVPVGYAGSWVSQKKTRLGIVAIGYGDGYPRYAKVGTPVLVNGKRVPLVGRVSMDMITVDLSEQSSAKPGDPVILWGDDLAVEEVASHSSTIAYTLLCGITQRVEKVEG